MSAPTGIELTELPHWLQLLQTAVDNSSRAAVARRLEYSRTTISQVLSGTYNGGTSKIEQKIMDVYGKVACPYLDYEISRSDCQSYCTAEAPVQNPSRMRHWRVCQGCEHHTVKDEI